VGHNIALMGVVGSTACGLATPESDEDRLGVFVRPTYEMLGLTQRRDSYVTKDPEDQTIHELGKFVRLCLACNPTVMELLWLPRWETISIVGEELIEMREHFLSARAMKTYGGYAQSQFLRLQTRNDGSFGSDTRKRYSKHARHLWRLLHQGKELQETGSLRVHMTQIEVEACRAFEELPPRDLILQGERLLADYLQTSCILPPEPNFDAVEQWLVGIRYRDLLD